MLEAGTRATAYVRPLAPLTERRRTVATRTDAPAPSGGGGGGGRGRSRGGSRGLNTQRSASPGVRSTTRNDTIGKG